MENWEFLLQKQGDKSWLPLESPTVEILEGQYRLASRTKFADALVGIQLRYIPCSDSIHKPSQQKIAKRVNSEGLLIVMPYTNFTPGTWQIECIECAELDEPEQEGVLHHPWLVSVQLEVQSVSAELASDWHLNLPILNLEAQGDLEARELDLTPSSTEPDIAVEADSAVIEAIADQVDQPNQPDQSELALTEFISPQPVLETPAETPILETFSELLPEPQVIEAIAAQSPGLPYNLIALNQSQYLVSGAEIPVLEGKSYLPGELEVVLKNPQDLETVMHARFALADPGNLGAPINFSFELHVPVQTSQVMIGEVRLHPSVDVATLLDSQPHVYYQAIALTYQSHDILAEVAQEITTASQLETLVPPPSDLVDASTKTRFIPQTARQQNILNPKLPQLSLQSSSIGQSSEQIGARLTNPVNKIPELPRLFPLPQSQLQSVQQSVQSDRNLEPSRSDQISESSHQVLEEPQINLEAMTSDSEDSELSSGFEDVAAYEVNNPTEELLVDQSTESLFIEIEAEAKPKVTLQSLQSSDRFLDKLQEISRGALNERLINQQVNEFIDAEVEKLESEIDKSLGLEDLDQEFEQMLIAEELLVDLDPETEVETDTIETIVTSQGDEVTAVIDVIDVTDVAEAAQPEDLLVEDNPDLQQISYEQESFVSDALYEVLAASQAIDRSTANASSVWPTLDTDQLVPLPVLEIPEGETISGVTLPILIKLPVVESKLFVKFWVKDCQTRNIIDGPRWLVDFQREDDTDFMIVKTPITLPLGTMEVAFEAIAVEMQTQRESRKASTIRSVTLPNLVQDDDVDFDTP
jgi:hypothetical protein